MARIVINLNDKAPGGVIDAAFQVANQYGAHVQLIVNNRIKAIGIDGDQQSIQKIADDLLKQFPDLTSDDHQQQVIAEFRRLAGL